MDNENIIVPEECLELLREHRTHYEGDFSELYSAELIKTFQGFIKFLPTKKAPSILDIGAGMGGIDVLFGRHYGNKAKLLLLDKNGKAETINAGFHKTADTFAHYCDFDAAASLLIANNVKNFDFYDVSKGFHVEKKFDVVISLLSWGFHYPIATYAPLMAKGGVIIADIRKGTNGIAELSKRGKVTVVHDAKKYQRVVVQC